MAEQQNTEYVVLISEPFGDGSAENDVWAWVETKTVTARDADAAKLLVAGEYVKGGESREFVAVPARSWKPSSVTAKVQTTFVIGGAS